CPVRTGGRCSYTKRHHPVSTVGAPVSGANGRLALSLGSIAVRTDAVLLQVKPDPIPGIEPQRRILIVGAPAPGANGRLALSLGSIAVRTVGGAPTGTPDPIPGIEPQRRILIVGAPVSGANGAGSEVWFDCGSHRGGAPTGTPDPFPGC